MYTLEREGRVGVGMGEGRRIREGRRRGKKEKRKNMKQSQRGKRDEKS